MEADSSCLADEVAFLGITALQSSCVDERETLLHVVGTATRTMPQYCASISGIVNVSSERPPAAAVNRGADSRQLEELWSLEALVYPIVSMSSAGNTVAAEVLPMLEAALGRAPAPSSRDRLSPRRSMRQGSNSSRRSSSERCSIALLGVRRLCMLEGNEETLFESCEELKRRAEEFEHCSRSSERATTGPADLEWTFCVLAPLLLRPGNGAQVHAAACTATVALVRAIPTLGVRLLPFVLYVIRRLGGVGADGGAVLRLLQLLPELGRHKVAAKPVASVIQSLATATKPAVRGVGLRLAAMLIGINSRYGLRQFERDFRGHR